MAVEVVEPVGALGCTQMAGGRAVKGPQTSSEDPIPMFLRQVWVVGKPGLSKKEEAVQ